MGPTSRNHPGLGAGLTSVQILVPKQNYNMTPNLLTSQEINLSKGILYLWQFIIYRFRISYIHTHIYALKWQKCTCAQSFQSCLTLCNPVDCSLRSSSVHGILQARILEWVSIPSSRGSSQPRDQTHISYVSCIDRQVLYHEHHLRSPTTMSQSSAIA